MEHIYTMPKYILDENGIYEFITILYNTFDKTTNSKIILDFSSTNYINPNLMAPLGMILTKLKSKNNILIPLADYFSDRLPAENWIIYDEDRKYAVVHRSDGKWVVVNDDKIKHMNIKEDQYEYLWKSFVHSVSIKERENLKLQQKMLPKRYRTNMTEFLEV